ncbi:hypothetical protein SFRURICE_000352, partial [Spodoptera frugiperda]
GGKSSNYFFRLGRGERERQTLTDQKPPRSFSCFSSRSPETEDIFRILESLTANRKFLKPNPPLTSVTGDHHGVQCVKRCRK